MLIYYLEKYQMIVLGNSSDRNLDKNFIIKVTNE